MAIFDTTLVGDLKLVYNRVFLDFHLYCIRSPCDYIS